MEENNVQRTIEELRKKILEADRAYYVDSLPVIPDAEYDNLFATLQTFEMQYPQYADKNSPTVRVGSDIDADLPERAHMIPVLSLDKCYSVGELQEWVAKMEQQYPGRIELIVEPKIDGAGVVLYYENGTLQYALTRGNGFTGNDITDNMKTIGSVPLRIPYQGKLAVRGEVYIEKEDFKVFNAKYAENLYANPRNLASGSVRRIKSKESAQFPLKLFVYEGFIEEMPFATHFDNLRFLKENGFPLNTHLGFFSDHWKNQKTEGDESAIEIHQKKKKQKTEKSLFDNDRDAKEDGFFFCDAVQGELDGFTAYVQEFGQIRATLAYEIDGLVFKINELAVREELGFTRHHPRWAIAYKFDAPVAVTEVESIVVQVGRGGRITPVAQLKPVLLSGSTIARATLHNQDYINALGLSVGDTVSISKRGDVIPAVEEVVEKGDQAVPYQLPDHCPACGSVLVADGAHLFCVNKNCPKRVLGTMQYFVSRSQMDIETLGDKTLEFLFENEFVKSIPDIYEFDYHRLDGYDGFGEKKIANIIASVNGSKEKPFKTVLASLGLKDLGEKVSELIVDHFGSIDAVITAAETADLALFTGIEGIGETLAGSIIAHFRDPLVLALIARLRHAGLKFVNENAAGLDESALFLRGTKWVITGSFEAFKPRDKAGELIKKYGGEVVGTVSSKTTCLLCGNDPGSKLDKAKECGVRVVEEEEFLAIMDAKKL